MVLGPGRYALRATAVSEDGTSYSANGELLLQEVGHQRSVRGMLTDGPVVSGTWEEGTLHFQLLYNASIPYRYTLRPQLGDGTWAVEASEGAKLQRGRQLGRRAAAAVAAAAAAEAAANRGTIAVEEWSVVATADEVAAEVRALVSE